MNSNFETIKQFFLAHQTGYVCYTVENTRDHMYSDYFTPPPMQDCFYLQFDPGWCEPCDPARYYIDPYDSFTFGISFVDYGDRIEVTDGNRTFECGCEAFEGNGLFAKYFDLVAKKAKQYGLLPITMEPFATELHKLTSPESCAHDAVQLIKLMLMCNHLDEKPPHLHEKSQIKADLAALKKTWNL